MVVNVIVKKWTNKMDMAQFNTSNKDNRSQITGWSDDIPALPTIWKHIDMLSINTGSIVVDGPRALRSQETIQLLEATPTYLVTYHVTHLSSTSAACIQRYIEACPGLNVS